MAEETKKTESAAAEPAEKAAKAPAEKTEAKAAGKPVKAKKGKAKRRTVLEGKVYIQATYNNTIVSITDLNGEVLAWSSAGSNGFKGAKKATPYAAQVSSENAANKAKVYGLEKVHVIVKGVGSGREQAIRGLHIAGLNIESLTDVTAIAHNGVRKRRARRV
ncbi:MAG: 30S ribosomal protein S11 [Candidatus Gracilibacteria bacterium]